MGLGLMDYLSPHESTPLGSAVHVIISQYINVLVVLIPPSSSRSSQWSHSWRLPISYFFPDTFTILSDLITCPIHCNLFALMRWTISGSLYKSLCLDLILCWPVTVPWLAQISFLIFFFHISLEIHVCVWYRPRFTPIHSHGSNHRLVKLDFYFPV